MLLHAARLQHCKPTAGPAALTLLARCASVSRQLRSAADLAAETAVTGHLSCGDDALDSRLTGSALSSAALQRWARHWTSLHLNDTAAALRDPLLPDLLRRGCSSVRTLHLSTGASEPAGTAYMEAAAGLLPGVQDLFCTGFIPAGALPQQLTSLDIECERCHESDLESLLVRLSFLERLQACALELSDGSILMRSKQLPTVQLRQLKSFQLCFSGIVEIDQLDLSYLGLPRSFVLTLRCWNQWAVPGEENWVEFLQGVQGALLPQDMLDLTVGFEGFCPAAQEIVSRLQLSEFRLDLQPQALLSLPLAPEIEITFSYLYDSTAHAAASLVWDDLVRTSGSITIWARFSQETSGLAPTLTVAGCQGLGSLPHTGPWQLGISGFGELSGLPPASKATARGYLLMNAAASSRMDLTV